MFLRCNIVEQTVALCAGERDSPSEFFSERACDGTFRLNESITAIAHFKTSAGRKTWCAGCNVKCACSGILAEKCSLWATKNLYLFNIDKIKRGCRGTCII